MLDFEKYTAYMKNACEGLSDEEIAKKVVNYIFDEAAVLYGREITLDEFIAELSELAGETKRRYPNIGGGDGDSNE